MFYICFLGGGEGRDVDEVYEINEVKSDNAEKGYFKRTHLRPGQEVVECDECKYTSVIVSSVSWQGLQSFVSLNLFVRPT